MKKVIGAVLVVTATVLGYILYQRSKQPGLSQPVVSGWRWR